MNKNIAIIPARGGSKRIPRKNIRPFMGIPVIAYSIRAALQSGLFARVMVSTDDPEIAGVARHYGADIPFLRSEKSSDDYATTTDVIIEVLDRYEQQGERFDTVTCLYATAPFVSSQKLIEAVDSMEKGGFDAIFSAVAFSYPVQRGLAITDGRIAMLHPEYRNTRSQDLPAVYHDAGQFYISTVEALRREKSFWGKNTGAVVFSELEVQDMDTETDWRLAEMKYSLGQGKKGTGNSGF